MSVLIITEKPHHKDLKKSLEKLGVEIVMVDIDGGQTSQRAVSFHDLYDCIRKNLELNTSIQNLLYVPANTLPGKNWHDRLETNAVITAAMAQWSKLDEGLFHEAPLSAPDSTSFSSVIRPGCTLLPAALFSQENTKFLHQSANRHVYELWLQLTAYIRKCGFEIILEAALNDKKPSTSPYKVCDRIGFAFPVLEHHKLYNDQKDYQLNEGYLQAYHEELYQEFKQALEANKLCEQEVAQAKKQGKQDKRNDLRSWLKQTSTSQKHAKANEKISVCMTSFPARFASLKKVLEQITPNVDAIYIHLNGAESAPDFISDNEKITVTFGEDFNATGKTRHLGKIEEGYVFILDDDNNIPPDYFQKSVEALQRYENKVAITYHGSILRPDSSWYYDKYSLYGYTKELEADALITLPGSGFLAYHSSLISLSFKDFMPYTMVDLLFAIQFRESGIPIVCVKRKNNWLTVQNSEEVGLWHLFKDKLTIHSLVATLSGNWSYGAYSHLYHGFFKELQETRATTPDDNTNNQSNEITPEDWTNSKGNVSLTTNRARLEFQSNLIVQFSELCNINRKTTFSNERIELQKVLNAKNTELEELHQSIETAIGQELAKITKNNSITNIFIITIIITALLSRKLFSTIIFRNQ